MAVESASREVAATAEHVAAGQWSAPPLADAPPSPSPATFPGDTLPLLIPSDMEVEGADALAMGEGRPDAGEDVSAMGRGSSAEASGAEKGSSERAFSEVPSAPQDDPERGA